MRHQMIFRDLTVNSANKVMNYCDDNNLSYEIWNAEEVFSNYFDEIKVQLGMSEKDWQQVMSVITLEYYGK